MQTDRHAAREGLKKYSSFLLWVSDQVIRENPASRGTETSAEVLVGLPWRMVFALWLSDQVIRENPANRGTETSAEVLVGPP